MKMQSWVLLVLLVATATPAHALEIVRGPYLQLRTMQGFTVRWRTDVATDSRLRWGTSPTLLDQEVSSPVVTTEHELRIEGAGANTQLWYAVGTSTEDLPFDPALHHGFTAPAPGQVPSVRVWVLGDGGLPGAAQEQVRDAYLQANAGAAPDVWVLLGDNAYVTGSDAEYQAGLFDPFAPVLSRTVVWPARGNHDESHPGAADDYFDFFTLPTQGEAGGVASGTESYWSFDHGDVHFLCFDSFEGDLYPPSAMLDWIAADLAATSARWVVAMTHYPPYSKGSHDSDLDSRMVAVRENVVPLLEAGGVDLVLSGHSHGYERSMLIDDHTGLSSTFGPEHVVDAGNGRREEDGAYRKPEARTPHAGAVYSVVGSSSRLNAGTLDHPAMWISELELGSLSFDASVRELSARFLTNTGVTRDWFSVIKDETTAVPGSSRFALRAHGSRHHDAIQVEFRLPRAGDVRLEVFDLRGRRVEGLVERRFEAGEHVAEWGGRDARGSRVARGAYLLRMVVDGQVRGTATVRVLR